MRNGQEKVKINRQRQTDLEKMMETEVMATLLMAMIMMIPAAATKITQAAITPVQAA